MQGNRNLWNKNQDKEKHRNKQQKNKKHVNKSQRIKKREKYKIASWIYTKIPLSIRRKWNQWTQTIFQHRYIDPKENKRAQMEFQLQQITIVFYGLIAVLMLTFLLIFVTRAKDQLIFERNPFGKGEKEIHFQMNYGKEKEEVTFSLEEKRLSPKEEQEVYRRFVKDLKLQICGENPSLQEVNHPLNLVEELEGYPFTITYNPMDLSLIQCNGELGEVAKRLTGEETRNTRISVEISYKEYEYACGIPIQVVAPQKKAMTFFEKIRENLLLKEENSREEDFLTVDESKQGITIKDSSHSGMWILPFLGLTGILLLLAKGYSDIKAEEKQRHQENMEDFPLIVHLLTLYMGAGLSFSSAVHRISLDYGRNQRKRNPRYAFEQIMIMDHCLEMGMRPKEACENWANQFQEKVYGKFSMLLSQSFSKGSKDVRSMMEKEQQDAFQLQVDYVRRAGEEASTRLLFPMIVLLVIIMILIIFPAALQFYAI